MKKKIVSLLNKIQEEKGVEILFAVESGSRVWGMESKDSDYDVRFVYCRKVEDYLRINKQPDVIKNCYNENLELQLDPKGCFVDMLGFDIYKYVRLLLTSNPSMIEWLYSDIVYLEDNKTKEFLKRFIWKKFNPLALYQHYRSMCKQNYLKYLKSGEMMTHKKYLYAMRGLVNANYVLEYDMIPPIKFDKTINMMYELMKLDVWNKLKEIISLKKDGFEQIKVSKIHLFEKHIEEFLENEEKIGSRRIVNFAEVQDYITKLLRNSETR